MASTAAETTQMSAPTGGGRCRTVMEKLGEGIYLVRFVEDSAVTPSEAPVGAAEQASRARRKARRARTANRALLRFASRCLRYATLATQLASKEKQRRLAQQAASALDGATSEQLFKQAAALRERARQKRSEEKKAAADEQRAAMRWHLASKHMPSLRPHAHQLAAQTIRRTRQRRKCSDYCPASLSDERGLADFCCKQQRLGKNSKRFTQL